MFVTYVILVAWLKLHVDLISWKSIILYWFTQFI